MARHAVCLKDKRPQFLGVGRNPSHKIGSQALQVASVIPGAGRTLHLGPPSIEPQSEQEDDVTRNAD